MRRDGVPFQGQRYVDPVLAAYAGETVTIRYDPRDLSEVRVSAIDRNGDNVSDIGVAAGAGSPPRFRFLDGRNLRQVGDELQVGERREEVEVPVGAADARHVAEASGRTADLIADNRETIALLATCTVDSIVAELPPPPNAARASTGRSP